MNVAINHCNNKTGDLVADRNHIDTHIILQCYRYHHFLFITVSKLQMLSVLPLDFIP